MLEHIADELSSRLVANHIIELEQRPYYTYGIALVLNNLLILFSVAFLALIAGVYLPSLLFTICFCVLRSMAGGYHCTTRLRCYCTSLAVYIAMLAVYKLFHEFLLVLSILFLVFSIVVTLWLAPMQHKNNPVTFAELKKYRRRTVFGVAIASFTSFGFMLFQQTDLSFALSWAMLMVTILLIFGKVQEWRNKND